MCRKIRDHRTKHLHRSQFQLKLPAVTANPVICEGARSTRNTCPDVDPGNRSPDASCLGCPGNVHYIHNVHKFQSPAARFIFPAAETRGMTATDRRSPRAFPHLGKTHLLKTKGGLGSFRKKSLFLPKLQGARVATSEPSSGRDSAVSPRFRPNPILMFTMFTCSLHLAFVGSVCACPVPPKVFVHRLHSLTFGTHALIKSGFELWANNRNREKLSHALSSSLLGG